MFLPVPATSRSWSYYALSILALALAIVLNIRAYTEVALRNAPAEWHESDFSYLDSDYPPALLPPSQHPRDVSLTIEESVHYAPNDTHAWASLFPRSGGSVRLGPRAQLYKVAMFHQLHCLDAMRRVVAAPRGSVGAGTKLHAQHCLNYIRESLLCASNMRLEAMKATGEDGGPEKTDGIGFEHRCRDWSLLRGNVEENYEGWTDKAVG